MLGVESSVMRLRKPNAFPVISARSRRSWRRVAASSYGPGCLAAMSLSIFAQRSPSLPASDCRYFRRFCASSRSRSAFSCARRSSSSLFRVSETISARVRDLTGCSPRPGFIRRYALPLPCNTLKKLGCEVRSVSFDKACEVRVLLVGRKASHPRPDFVMGKARRPANRGILPRPRPEGFRSMRRKSLRASREASNWPRSAGRGGSGAPSSTSPA